MNKLLSMLVFIISISSSVIANSDANESGKSFAKSMNATINAIPGDIDPYSVPNYQGEDVPEKQYYNSGKAIENEAAEYNQTNETGQYVTQSNTKRPEYTINPNNDPMFDKHASITQQASSLTDTYSGCVDLPSGSNATQYKTETCYVHGKQDEVEFNCQKYLLAGCSNANAGTPNPFTGSDFKQEGDVLPLEMHDSGDGSFVFGSKDNHRNTNDCKSYETTIRVYIDDLTTITSFAGTEIEYDDWLDVSINDELLFRGIGSLQGLDLDGDYKCEWGKNYKAADIDFRPKLKVGWNTIKVKNLVYGGGGVYIRLHAGRVHGCDATSDAEEFSYSCPSGESIGDGHFKSSTCVSGPETRKINGFDITRDCWEWTDTYSRLGDPYFEKDAKCKLLEEQGCGQTSTHCDDENDLYCKLQVTKYDCPYDTSEKKVSLCGSQLVCPDGNCTNDVGRQTEDATGDFQRAATGLAVANDASKYLDENSLTVFNGERLACEIAVADIYDCCKNSGWGKDIGLASCDAEEKKLGQLKESEQVVYVGKYCSEKIDLGVSKICVAWKKVYCSYPSKLARIVIQQGKSQLGQNYGHPKKPNCKGFTIHELENLDFNAMDLSEYFSDVMQQAANGSTPTGDVSQTIQQKLLQRYPEMEGNKQ